MQNTAQTAHDGIVRVAGRGRGSGNWRGLGNRGWGKTRFRGSWGGGVRAGGVRGGDGDGSRGGVMHEEWGGLAAEPTAPGVLSAPCFKTKSKEKTLKNPRGWVSCKVCKQSHHWKKKGCRQLNTRVAHGVKERGGGGGGSVCRVGFTSTWQGHAVLGMGSLTGPRIPAPAPAGGGDGGGAVGGGAPLLIRRTFVGVAGDHVVYGGGGGGDNHATAPPGLNPLFVDFRINDKET